MHLSIGEIYAFSVFKNLLVDRFGTGPTPIGIIFSISIVMLGLSAAVFGTWVERAGPRAAMFTAALYWPSGFFVSALGVATPRSCGSCTWATASSAASGTYRPSLP